MNQEIEVKFLNVNFDELRAKLKKLGAVCEQPMRTMKRAIIDFSDNRLQKQDAYIRVRDEGDKITLTFKQFKSLEFGDAHEIEQHVESFGKTVALFEKTGLVVKSLQESKRETWRIGDVEVVFDEWPWLKPYIEIEGSSESSVKKVASELDFDWQNAVFGDVMAAYRAEYPYLDETQTVGELKAVRFQDPLPDLLKPKQ